MDAQVRAYFRRLLLERADEFRRRRRSLEEGGFAGSLGESLGELSTYDNHPADIGGELQFRSQDLAFRAEADGALERVQAALARLDDGTYGLCLRCGRGIDRDRLEALPEAELCLACQQRAEAEASLAARAGGRGGRPVEEAALSPPFGRTFTDGTDNAAYDGEDAWQDAARHGTSETPSDVQPQEPRPMEYPDVYEDAEEPVGVAQAVEMAPMRDAAYEWVEAGAPLEEDGEGRLLAYVEDLDREELDDVAGPGGRRADEDAPPPTV
ncbi:MAG: TraR/DksA C4-type zinc finger protein [Firmicutes bacterium]|nr:TraR/DksA C4-type zinc finger protein [Bacillota bacterium]